MTSVFGSLNGNLLVGPRLLFAMGRDGLAPTWLNRLHPRYGTPAVATFVYALWSCLLVARAGLLLRNPLPPGFADLDINFPAGKAPFDVVTDFAMFGAVAFETLAVASIFVFRWKYPAADRPYRCWGYPVVPALYVVIMAAVLANMFVTPEQLGEARIGAVFIGVGAAVYLGFLRHRRSG